MRGLPARTILCSILAAGAFSGTALADAIDGDWCNSGRQFTIRGPEIVTPAGSAIRGNYDRHAFAYVVPENEPEAGAEIYMQLLNEETLRLMVGSWNADGEVWRRCEFVS
jgi:hypothetical protein